MTVQAQPEDILVKNGDNTERQSPRQKLAERVGEELIPLEFESDKTLVGTGLARASRQIIDNQIRESVRIRNMRLRPVAHLEYNQFLNFHYNDGVRMMTVGGIITEQSQRNLLLSSGLDQLEFYRPGDEAYTIPYPKLTYREISYLNRHLPRTEEKLPSEFLPIPQYVIDDYLKVYRYFPNYVDADT